jgi:hypothetical protein
MTGIFINLTTNCGGPNRPANIFPQFAERKNAQELALTLLSQILDSTNFLSLTHEELSYEPNRKRV